MGNMYHGKYITKKEENEMNKFIAILILLLILSVILPPLCIMISIYNLIIIACKQKKYNSDIKKAIDIILYLILFFVGIYYTYQMINIFI